MLLIHNDAWVACQLNWVMGWTFVGHGSNQGRKSWEGDDGGGPQ